MQLRMRNQQEHTIDIEQLATVTGGTGENDPKPVQPIRPGMVGGGPINMTHAQADAKGDMW